MKKRQRPISANIREVAKYMKTRLGVGVSYDVGFRKLIILKKEVQIYYVNGFVDVVAIVELIQTLSEINDVETNQRKLFEIIENRIVNEQVDILSTMDEVIDELLAGLVIIFVEGEDKAFALDIRSTPGRSPEEPDTERVVRGSRDGYTENIVVNTVLTRRRIRDERLRHEMMRIGERSKTDVCISYIQDIADDRFVNMIKHKLSEIEIDGISMADKAIEEYMADHKINPFPIVRYTERPDVAAHHLLSGHVVVMVDTSPSVMILPTTYFDHLEHAEEYRQTPTVGTFTRWIRILAVLASLFLLPLWYLYVKEPNLLPEALSFIGPEKEGNIPIFLQIILALAGIEFLRMAAIHTPTPLATALGLIAAVLIGQIAVDVGLFSPEVILYVAIATIGFYVTPSYELGVANRLILIFILIMTALFEVSGFMIAITLSILYLVYMKSIRTPYLWPLIPFNGEAMFNFLLRIPVPYSFKRPSYVNPKDVYRQKPIKKD